MKIILAILLIGAGAWLLWQGGTSFTYREKDKTVVDVGIAQLKADVQRRVDVPAYWGWVGIGLGVVVLFVPVGRR